MTYVKWETKIQRLKFYISIENTVTFLLTAHHMSQGDTIVTSVLTQISSP